MIQNHTIRSSVSASMSASMSAELTESLQSNVAPRRWDGLDHALGLPSTAGGFALVVAAVILIGAMMTLLIMTSVQTFQLRQQIIVLEQQHQAVERQNAEIVWQIAQHTPLEQIRRRAAELGYATPVKRHYVTAASLAAPETAPVAGVAPADSTTPPTGAHTQLATNPDLWDWAVQQFSQLQRWWQP